MNNVVLQEVIDTIIDYRGKTPKKLGSDWRPQGIPAISAKNIKNGTIVRRDTIRYVDKPTYDKWMKEKVREGDIIMTSEAPLGETYFVKDDKPFVLSQRLFAIRTNADKLDPRYFYLLTKTAQFQKILQTYGTGATVSGIRQQLLRKLPLVIDDVKKQQKIADIVWHYDELIENNTKRISILEEMARLRYAHLINNSSTVDFMEIKDACETPRETVSGKSLSIGTNYIGLEHIPRRSLGFKFIGQIDNEMSSKLKFKTGDILFSKIRPYFHKVAPAPVDGVTSSDAIVIRPHHEHYGLVLMTVCSDDFMAHAVQSSNGTKMPRANWDVLKKYRIPKLKTEQETAFNEYIVETVSLIRNLTSRNEKLSKLRDMLLPRLISGEIEI